MVKNSYDMVNFLVMSYPSMAICMFCWFLVCLVKSTPAGVKFLLREVLSGRGLSALPLSNSALKQIFNNSHLRTMVIPGYDELAKQ